MLIASSLSTFGTVVVLIASSAMSSMNQPAVACSDFHAPRMPNMTRTVLPAYFVRSTYPRCQSDVFLNSNCGLVSQVTSPSEPTSPTQTSAVSYTANA